MELLFALVLWTVCGMAARAVAAEGKKDLGMILGFLFGPLGVLVVAIALSKK